MFQLAGSAIVLSSEAKATTMHFGSSPQWSTLFPLTT